MGRNYKHIYIYIVTDLESQPDSWMDINVAVLPKEEDSYSTHKFHPISLLNNDYKIVMQRVLFPACVCNTSLDKDQTVDSNTNMPMRTDNSTVELRGAGTLVSLTLNSHTQIPGGSVVISLTVAS